MKKSAHVNLAWKNLAHNYRKLSVAVAGITFAVVLMFVERGFQHALFDSTIYVVRDLEADLIIRSRGKKLFEAPHWFEYRRLHQAETHPQVHAVYPVYVQVGQSALRRIGKPSYPIRVLAFDVSEELCRFEGIRERAHLLEKPMTALIDEKSKQDAYHLPLDEPNRLPAIPTELAGQQIQLSGTFTLGTDFANDGTLIMTPQNFARYFPYRGSAQNPRSLVDLGLIHLAEGADPQVVKEELAAILPSDVFVETKAEFVRGELDYWSKSTPVGFVFLLGVVLGFVVGIVICYQIIFANISDHQAEFATLKAMGYPTRFFVGLVFGKAFYLSILGFLPGLLISTGVFSAISYFTGLQMELTLVRVVSIYLLTALMCCVSGAIAIRKVLELEPAELF